MPIAVPGDMPVATPVGVADPPPQQPSGYAMPTGNMIDRLANKVNDMADQALGQANKDLKDSRASLVPPDYSGPPALALLALPRQVRLKQKVEAVELVAAWASTQGFGDGFETANQYQLKDLRGNQLMYVAEEGGYCDLLTRQGCRSCMPLNHAIVSNDTKQLALRFSSPAACCAPCCCCLVPTCCCLRTINIERFEQMEGGGGANEDGSGELAAIPYGKVQEQCNFDTTCCLSTKYHAYAPDGEHVYTYYQTGGVRECWNCLCGGCDMARLCTCDISQFNVFRPGGEEANAVPGKGSMDRISCMMKTTEYEPSGDRFVNPADGKSLGANLLDLGKDLAREQFTDADDYMIEFPDDSVQHKVLIVAGALLHDYLVNEEMERT